MKLAEVLQQRNPVFPGEMNFSELKKIKLNIFPLLQIILHVSPFVVIAAKSNPIFHCVDTHKETLENEKFIFMHF
jgi:hypothetical protein